MRIPVQETELDGCEFFVGVYGTVTFFFVFERSVGINCCFCERVSRFRARLKSKMYFAALLGFSFGMLLTTCRMVMNVLGQLFSLPWNGFCKSENERRERRP